MENFAFRANAHTRCIIIAFHRRAVRQREGGLVEAPGARARITDRAVPFSVPQRGFLDTGKISYRRSHGRASLTGAR